MVLVAAAHVAHGQVHHVRHNGRVGDARGGRAHEHLHIRIFTADNFHQAVFHLVAHLGRGQGQAVVAVNGALDAAGPGEGFLGPEKHRADGQ